MKTSVKLDDRRFSMPLNQLGNLTSLSKHTATVNDDPSLPQVFAVKYLGKCEASGLWGIKHTRKPVDKLVSDAKKTTKSGAVTLPYLKLTISEEGVDIAAMPQNQNPTYDEGLLPIQIISYGVQDLVYTRVFAMITVRESSISSMKNGTSMVQKAVHPLQCHAFVCDSHQTARQLTISLANAFKIFSKTVKTDQEAIKNQSKKFAIDLRGPGDMEKDQNREDGPEDSEV